MELVGRGIRKSFDRSDFPFFRPRLPWLGGDLQTLRNSFVGTSPALTEAERLLAPIDVGAINLAVNLAEESNGRILLLVHGLGGSEDSVYMLDTASYFLAQGYHVLRMNYRGVGPSALTSEAPYSAGLTSDLRAVLRRIEKRFPDMPVYLMGFSLGGQLSLRMLGEGDVPPRTKACVTVSAPLDLATSQRKLERRRNRPYARYVVNNMQQDLNGVSHPKVSADPMALRTVWDFDEQIIAPVFGFKGAADYYERVSCLPLLERISTPALAIHAADDPWIPVEDYYRAQWPAESPSGALIAPGGGHVGFHGKENTAPWYLDAASVFFEQS